MINHILKEFDLNYENISIFVVASSFILFLIFFFNRVRKNLKSGINRFDDEDRFTRMQHFPRFGIIIGLNSVLAYFSNSMKDGNPIIGIGIFVIAILLTAYYFDIAKKRFHDFNMSGWYGLLLFIPVLNFIILLGLFFIPGTKKQDNFYL